MWSRRWRVSAEGEADVIGVSNGLSTLDVSEAADDDGE